MDHMADHPVTERVRLKIATSYQIGAVALQGLKDDYADRGLFVYDSTIAAAARVPVYKVQEMYGRPARDQSANPPDWPHETSMGLIADEALFEHPVMTIYRLVFGREADDVGRRYWIGQVSSGTPLHVVIRDMIVEGMRNGELSS